MNDEEVIAKDTIFQAFMNVETDSYRTFLPGCEDCSGCVDTNRCLKKGEDCCGGRSHRSLQCGLAAGYRCGCLPDGTCQSLHMNTTRGDEDCCSFQSHWSLWSLCRKCGPMPGVETE